MDGVYRILQAFWQGIVHGLAVIWAGWQGIVDWVTQVALAQIGITMRETGDVVDYLSGVVAIAAAVFAAYRWLRPRGSPKVVQAYQRLNAAVTRLIIALRHKHVTEADHYYNAFMAELHESKYLLNSKDRAALFAHWTPAKYEHQHLYQAIKDGMPDKVNPVHLQALQLHIQQKLTALE